jgi:hypothetical protein
MCAEHQRLRAEPAPVIFAIDDASPYNQLATSPS